MLKIHEDRSFKDTVSFEELQKMAKRCMEAPEDREREEIHWHGKLGISDYLTGRSMSISPCHDPPDPMTDSTWVNRQIVQGQEKVNKSTRKRKIASGTFSQGDSASKQSRLD